jgi:hypothetical protein
VEQTTDIPALHLENLHDGYPCLTPQSGARLAWAAAVCLEER